MTGTPEDRERLRWEQTRIAQARAGDRRAFGELYDAYAPILYRRILLPRLGDPAAAEDALSETFRSAIENIHRFEGRDVSIYRWLSRIAHNKAMDLHRVRAVTGRKIRDIRALLEPLCVPESGADALFELAVEARDVEQLVQRTLASINPRYCRAIEARFFEDKSRDACASELNVKLGTFDVLLLRALRAFRAHWEKHLAKRLEGTDGEANETATVA